jgi:glyoxylase-like metal-dependent hydrolase (beta-lactamase superfamily II)
MFSTIIERVSFRHLTGIRVGWKAKPYTNSLVWRIGSTLIDSGDIFHTKPVLAFCKEIPLAQAIITHHHEDHSGNGYHLQRTLRIPVMMHPAGVAFARDGFPMTFDRIAIHGKPRKFTPDILPESVQTEHGSLTCLHTPGHAADHVCFLDKENGVLFTGDMYVSPMMHYLYEVEDASLILENLLLLQQQDFDVVVCSHSAINMNGKQKIARKAQYLGELQAKAKTLFHRGLPIRVITEQLLGKETIVAYATDFRFSKRNLIKSLIFGGTPRRGIKKEILSV